MDERGAPMADYWRNLVQARINRRRMLAVTGGAAATAALLAACGSSDSGSGGGGNGSSGSDKGGQVVKPVDTTSSAKAGGVLKHYSTGDTLHFDALASNSAAVVGNASIYAYARLLKFKSGKTPAEPDGSVVGEMAESYEIAPDKLSVTLKLRQGVKWDPRPPTSGRE